MKLKKKKMSVEKNNWGWGWGEYEEEEEKGEIWRDKNGPTMETFLTSSTEGITKTEFF